MVLKGEGEPFPGARAQFPEICGPVVETPSHVTKEKDGLWGKTRRHEVNGQSFNVTTFGVEESTGAQTRTQVGPLGTAVEMLTAILSADDPVFINALMANLSAFSRAIRVNRDYFEHIRRLTAENNQLKERIDALEQKIDTLLNKE